MRVTQAFNGLNGFNASILERKNASIDNKKDQRANTFQIKL